MVYLREMPAKPIFPGTIKPLLDPADGNYAARGNFTNESQEISFPIAWTFVGASNSNPTVHAELGEGHGMESKIYQLRPR